MLKKKEGQKIKEKGGISQELPKKIQIFKDENSNNEVHIQKRVSIETGIEFIDIEITRYPLNGNIDTYKLSEINQKNLTKLMDYGFYINEFEIAEIVDSIKQKVKELKPIYFYTNVGWIDINKNKMFRGFNLLGNNLKFNSNYRGEEFDLKSKGSLENWVDEVRRNITGNKLLELILSAGFAAPLINILSQYNKIKGLIINLNGLKTTQKNSAIKLALSPWGNIDLTEKSLLKRWNGEKNKDFNLLKGNFGLPIGINDISINERNRFIKWIYELTSEELYIDRAQYYGTQRENSWQTIIFSSTEDSIVEEIERKKSYIQNMILEIDCDETSLMDDINNILSSISNNSGKAGEEFIKYILKQGFENVYMKYETVKKSFIDKIKVNKDNDEDMKVDMIYRSIEKLSLIQLSAILVNEVFNLNFDIERLEEFLLSIDRKFYDYTPTYQKLLNEIIGYFTINQFKFAKNDEKKKSGSIGIYETNEKNLLSKIKISNDNFKKIAESIGYNYLNIKRELKKHNYLECEKGRYDKKFKFGNVKTRGIVICLDKHKKILKVKEDKNEEK